MALSWNEIKSRALQFTNEWEGETRERAEKDSFWNDFFNIFGISRRRLATFEEPVKKLNNNLGFIDLFWKGTLLVEHKSNGKDLDAAFKQATDYFHGLKEHELPKYVLVSDFEHFRLYDLDEGLDYAFPISELYKNIKLFGFIAGYQKRTFKDEDPVNIEAAELMGKLHDQLEESGYKGHSLEVFLVRLLFCLFADDTGIFERDTFKEFVDVKTKEDGSDLGGWLAQFFQVLNTPNSKRLKNLDEHLTIFPYVNGKLFEEALPIASFNSAMREILLECSKLNWGEISPAIFGSMFQSVMNPEERRNLGAHYTSEKNILKLIRPLFLDALQEEFDKIHTNKNKLREFHKKLGSLRFMDPACGCGNFLIITYREIRLLELQVLKQLYGTQQVIGIDEIMMVEVDQFYGIEYDEFPARIAEVAMWLMDHQMNLLVSEAFGLYYARLPLQKSATIVHGNALQVDWEDVVKKTELNYILGNPPFVGERYQSKEQREEIRKVFGKKLKVDYVAAWYFIAANYIQGTTIKVGFVSTNSIMQGEQVVLLWKHILTNLECHIHFAHKTFKWSNEARGKAAVYCVIVGFADFDTKEKYLFEYEDISGEPHSKKVKNINAYLVDAQSIFIDKRRKPINKVKKLRNGSRASDKGYLLFTLEEKNSFILKEPNSAKYFKRTYGAREFINNIPRYALWLEDIAPSELRKMKYVLEIIEKIKEFRPKTPHLFKSIRKPKTDYLFIPQMSSSNRDYIPIGFLEKGTIPLDPHFYKDETSFFEFGILTSKMHMAWIKYTCGRLKNDIRYSNTIVYNNYPWPKDPSKKNKDKVAAKAQKVLDVRAAYPNSSLADLYDPLTMPPNLVKAHQALDKAVDVCYRPQPFTNETGRIEYLFTLYDEYTMPLLENKKR
ncbi:class I SAM-dependent DNA methyltransferase [Marixanthomonas spongiae]|uniref:site-specific DNA-methyltransferase (adenine-specific) n=1 Tax=Marixanthomonas spongiae TaxID=2174845 RepID=A0A2U0HWD8_9FLAO|nr:DNA methyltransferase [Marixanthomonas spongiae]PVW13167.1 SAM-dependent methyltransferase [Marixanthomonas spongiae]